MPAESFSASLLSWRDFYVAVAEASAALLGLLFVGVSIRLSTLATQQRPEQRARAALAFGNLICAMILSLIVLIPNSDAPSIALQVALVATIAGIRIVRRTAELVAAWSQLTHPVATGRRLGWAAIAVGMLAYAAIGLWTAGSATYLYALLASVFIFLIGAADVAWDLLTHDEVTG